MSDLDTQPKCQPFLKWAGGKRWIVDQCSRFIPPRFNTYIEPFLGSGAMFFAIHPKRATLSDLNSELIQTYIAIRRDWRTVERALRRHDGSHSPQYYYLVRASRPTKPSDAAARFVYLNRTCWNGLYRVNKNGDFNVPIGTKNRACLASDDFRRVSELLANVRLANSDFEAVIDGAKKGDLVFVDPPYTTLHNNNGFIKYNEKLFTWLDQIRLRDCLVRATSRGATIIAANADHESIRVIYRDFFAIRALQRPSVIAASAQFRRTVGELLITSREDTDGR
jgi:DNA adenine methylase